MQKSQIVTGEAPESDVEEFGSTISLASSENSIVSPVSDKLLFSSSSSRNDHRKNVSFGVEPQHRGVSENLTVNSSLSPSLMGNMLLSPKPVPLDKNIFRKHRETNISLRYNITEKLLRPVLAQNIRKVERLSQNLSNTQIQMQEALFQSKLAAKNLQSLQVALRNLVQLDYLSEMKPPDSYASSSSTTSTAKDIAPQNPQTPVPVALKVNKLPTRRLSKKDSSGAESDASDILLDCSNNQST